MCGLAGALSFDPGKSPVTEPFITRMRETMVHRGPDGFGTWVSGDARIGLGHRRLSIVDLSPAAAQPMCNEDGTLWISYNGEIYNHAQIRNELEQTGRHRWKTDHSDTEVILHAFEEWGIDCLHRFRGMFALALWDDTKKELWLARDRIGIKPIYYSRQSNRILFASEIKALLSDPAQNRAVNEEAFYHYLSFLTSPAPQTLFEGIHKLPGGTWLRIAASGDMRETRYWDVWDHVHPMREQSEAEVCRRILDELRTAVRLRKMSDVPIGVFLSGGIDSSTNTALFSEGESRPVKTFSIGYAGDYRSCRNELHFARIMAGKVGAEHHEKELTLDDLLDFLPRMVYLQDEPIADPVCVPVYYVSKLARDNGVTVCQVGEGADELFWGYPGWKMALDLERKNRWPVPRAVKQLLLTGLRALGREQTFYYEWLRRACQHQPVFWGGAEAFTEGQKQRLLSSRLRHQFRNFSSWEALAPIHRRFSGNSWEPSPLNWMSYLDLNLRLPELLLMRVDKMSMGVSLEGRVPFLDHKFVELAFSIPSAMKTRNGELKHLLKRSVTGLIPDELIHRPKQGFGVPLHEWLRDRLGTRIRSELMEFCDQTDFLDRGEVLKLIEKGSGSQVWYLFNFALWWKEFVHQP
ncbi:MAG: asparagine synthase (glutamine-hydrolyzing) [Nitrospinae bacterium CG11_big_fil_rev_8_21_14_0_20_56_8]|nr:MAG: asparagine synthase (glutamine-hydrolyzing) [Nitrospinae bacterium CG11_big_fil_rev_8_21_14_0_20_56_8]